MQFPGEDAFPANRLCQAGTVLSAFFEDYKFREEEVED
jgi:hypothetical protein